MRLDPDDLEEVAKFLKGEIPALPSDVRSRVATQLIGYATNLRDRRSAKAVGCSLKYYRKCMK